MNRAVKTLADLPFHIAERFPLLKVAGIVRHPPGRVVRRGSDGAGVLHTHGWTGSLHLHDCDAKIALVSNRTQGDKIAAVRAQPVSLETVVVMDTDGRPWPEGARGEVTPTMKVKRRVIEERWRAVIEKLYEEASDRLLVCP